MAHATPVVEAALCSLAPPRPIATTLVPDAVHCTSCFLRGEQCIASSSSDGDPLDPTTLNLPTMVRAQISAFRSIYTPPPLKTIARFETPSSHSISSNVFTLFSSGWHRRPPSLMALPASPAPCWFDGEPAVIRVDSRRPRWQLRGDGEGFGGLQWLGKSLHGMGGRIPSSSDEDGEDTRRMKTAPVKFAVPDEPVRFYVEDDLIWVEKHRHGAKWKGKGKESEYVDVETEDASTSDGSRGAFSRASERLPGRSAVGKRVVERVRGTLGSMKRRRGETRELMVKAYAGIDYTP